MATFIEEAQALLSAEKFSRLELLRMKSSNFESTNDEELEFAKLKNEVRTAINNRDKDKNLQFISDPSISLVDIFRVKKVTKEQFNKAGKEFFPPVSTVTTEPVIIVKISDKEFPVRMGKGEGVRVKKFVTDEVKKNGVKGFVKSLTAFGKEWIAKSHVSAGGPKSGELIFDNIAPVVLRFDFKKDELIKELVTEKVIILDKKK